MKISKLFIIFSLPLLTACVGLQFDALEYDRYLTITEQAETTSLSCGTVEVVDKILKLKQMTDHQYSYSIFREGRPQVNDAAKNLKEIVDGMYVRYNQQQPVSIGYCKEKLKNIALGSATIVRVLGRL